MKNPEVQREIQRKMTKRLEKLEVTQDSVLRELNDIIEAAKDAGAGAWQMQARLKAVELQGKFLKMFTDKVEVGLDDALMEWLLEGRKRAGSPLPEEQPALLAVEALKDLKAEFMRKVNASSGTVAAAGKNPLLDRRGHRMKWVRRLLPEAD